MKFLFTHPYTLWVQKFLGTDIRYLVTNTAWLLAAQVVGAIASLILTIAYANLLPQETYGSLRYLLAVSSILTLVSLPGVNTVVTRELSRGYNFYRESIKLRFIFSLLASAAALAGASYYFVQGAADWLFTGYLVIAIAIPLSEVYTTVLSTLEAQRNFRVRSLVGLLDTLIPATILVGALFVTNSVIVILLILFGSHAAIRFLAHVFLQPTEKPLNMSSNLKKDSLVFTIFQALSTATNHFDKILLFALLGPTSVAIFSIANAFPERLKDLPRIIAVIAFPKFSVGNPKDTISSLPWKIFLLALSLIGISVLYILLAPFIFTLLFPTYLESVGFSQILSLSLIYAAAYPLGALFTAHNFIRALYGTALISSIVGFIALAFLIPLYGIWGAVIGTILARVAHSCTSIYYFFVFVRKHKNS